MSNANEINVPLEGDIIKSSKPIQDAITSGIYYLISGNDIVYVGKSVNLLARIADHIRGNEKDFDGYFLYQCHISTANMIEPYEIMHYLPKYNTSLPPNTKWMTKKRIARFIRFALPELNKYIAENKIVGKQVGENLYFDIKDFGGMWNEKNLG